MKKVLYVTNLPAPYKVSFFDLLSRKIDLTVVYEREKASNRDEEWKSNLNRNYKEIYIKGKEIGVESSFSFGIINILKKNKYDLIMMNGYSSPTCILAIAYMVAHRIKYTIVCDGMLPKSDTITKKMLKTFMIKNAMNCLSSGHVTDMQLLRYGAERKNIYRYPFGSLRETDVSMSEHDKSYYRSLIGCNSSKVILFVGQFIERKGVDILFEALDSINDDFTLYMIGGSKEQAKLFKGYDNKHIVYCGFKSFKELSAYYKAADIFVLPTREDIWGLVINEAMMHGLPVITTKCCGAGLEMITQDSGYIINKSDELSQIINQALNRNWNNEKIIEIGKMYSLESMSDSMLKFIDNTI